MYVCRPGTPRGSQARKTGLLQPVPSCCLGLYNPVPICLDRPTYLDITDPSLPAAGRLAVRETMKVPEEMVDSTPCCAC